MGRIGILEKDIGENWYFSVLEEQPVAPPDSHVTSIFHTKAEEIIKIPSSREYIYDFPNTTNWVDVGIQVLASTGWRGDSAQSQSINLKKCLPPDDPSGEIVIGSSEQMRWYPQNVTDEPNDDSEKSDLKMLEVTVGVFFQSHTGASCSWMRCPDGEAHSQGWVHGTAQPDTPAPACLEMLGLKHALILVKEFLEGPSNNTPDRVVIRALNGNLTECLLSWFN